MKHGNAFDQVLRLLPKLSPNELERVIDEAKHVDEPAPDYPKMPSFIGPVDDCQMSVVRQVRECARELSQDDRDRLFGELRIHLDHLEKILRDQNEHPAPRGSGAET